MDQYLVLGGSEGLLEVWDFLKVQLLQEIKSHLGPVTAVAVSADCSVVVSGGEDGYIHVWCPCDK